MDWLNIVLWTTAAGITIPLGGLLASVENIQTAWLEKEFRHFVIAFGGGVLLAAVMLVLVPEGSKELDHPWAAAGIVLAGGAAFLGFERWLDQRGSGKPQLVAMLADFVPESLALGGMFAAGAAGAPLLAGLIALQNLPEGFNAYRELRDGGHAASGQVLLWMLALVPLGPAAGLLGWHFLSGMPMLLGGIMLFASGGILYLVFQDIAPQSRLERHWAPPLGAVCGFALALLGNALLGAH